MHGRTFAGVILVLLGLGFLLDNLNVIKFSELLSIYWPVILIIIGVNHFLNQARSFISGSILVLVGLFFLLRNVGMLPADLAKLFWPAALIIIGILIIFGKSKHDSVPTSTGDSVNHFVIFSGLDSRCTAQNFKGGSATALFGGIELDLRDANMDPEGAVLDLTAAFGGVGVKVPASWRVAVAGTPIFGAWEDKTRVPSEITENQPVLNIKCLPIFGGIEISN
ncbi:MAG: DUF5668 domain-containing protein [Bacillota bacterium]